MAKNEITRREATARILGTAATTGAISSLFAQQSGPPEPAVPTDWNLLADRVEGAVIPSTDGAFTEARDALIWNGVKTNRAPVAIVRVKTIDDVQRAVNFARENNLKVAIRGGGHSWCASSVRETGIVLDLGALNSLDIDADNKRAVAGSAVTGGELINALAPHTLAFPVGHCPTVPLSGYILAGGFGWNTGNWGPACANLIGLDIVTADGKLIYADHEQNPDYFWAARGAGPGFFGVAVRYHLQLHESPKAIRTQLVHFPFDAVDIASAWLSRASNHLRPELELTCIIGPAPAGVPESMVNTFGRAITLSVTAFADSDEDAQRWLKTFVPPKQLAHHAPPSVPMSFEDLLGAMAQSYPAGHRYAADMMWCDAAPAELLPTLARTISGAPSRQSFALLAVPAPSFLESPPTDMALSMFSRALVGMYSVWDDANADVAHQAWLLRAAFDVRRDTVGYYVGETDFTVDINRPRSCFGAKQWKKLEDLRRAHDPAGVFHTFLGKPPS